MKNLIFLLGLFFLIQACSSRKGVDPGYTEITKWPDNKRAAVSLTYDDGSVNQFRVAMPIMDSLSMPGTFFINTTKVKGSAKGKFIGRPARVIIKESASVKTNAENFFERASLIRFTGIEKAVEHHTKAGSLFESGKTEDAYKLMDEAYTKVRIQGYKQPDLTAIPDYAEEPVSWEDFKTYTAKGHEIACHTVTHAKLAVLDEPNLLYELEQCKADIETNLGHRSVFTAECPYGTENERVMDYAHKIFPALRNRMPEPFLEELNRASKKQPGESQKEYVQWQRGPIRKISMQEMKSYVDTCLNHRNIWLVLVFHGIDGIGWEPRTGAEVREYFSYMKAREPYLWVATFGDVARYMRERKHSTLNTTVNGDSIVVNTSCSLDTIEYDVPLTFKTYVPGSWKETILESKAGKSELKIQQDSLGSYVLYPIKSGKEQVVLRKM